MGKHILENYKKCKFNVIVNYLQHLDDILLTWRRHSHTQALERVIIFYFKFINKHSAVNLLCSEEGELFWK